MSTICFTGPADSDLRWGYSDERYNSMRAQLAEIIRSEASVGSPLTVITGCASGVDTIAAEAALIVRDEKINLQLVMARPWPAHTAGLGRGYESSAWDAADAKAATDADYHVIVSQIDPVSAIAPNVDRPDTKLWGKLFSARNAYMVDHADKAIGVWDRNTRATIWEGRWSPPVERNYITCDWAYYVTHTYDWSRRPQMSGRLYGSGTGNTLTEALAAGCDISVYRFYGQDARLEEDQRVYPESVERLRTKVETSRPDLKKASSLRSWKDDAQWKKLLAPKSHSNFVSLDTAISNLEARSPLDAEEVQGFNF